MLKMHQKCLVAGLYPDPRTVRELRSLQCDSKHCAEFMVRDPRVGKVTRK